MSRELHGIELGINLFEENGDELAYVLSGTSAPDGTSGKQGDAPIGSIYLRSGTGELYQKVANAGAAGDWLLNGNSSATIGRWRNENVSVVTNDTQGVGVRDIVANPFADDDGTPLAIGDFVVGEYIISDADGTPALLEITNVTSPNVTFAAAASSLVDEDTFIVKNYLPDPDGGENRALVNYNGSVMLKLSDIDWQIATGINLSGSYAAATGDVASNDTVEAAIAKIDGNVDQLTAAVGVAQGAANMGTYTGSTLTDNQSAKQNLQELETALEAISPVNGGPADIAQNTATVVDSVLVDECQSVEWEVTAHDIGTPGNVKVLTILGFHNGHELADATTVKDNVYAKARIGNFNLQADVTLSGTGAAQAMNLVLETSDSDGIRYTVQRRQCVSAL